MIGGSNDANTRQADIKYAGGDSDGFVAQFFLSMKLMLFLMVCHY